MQGLVQGHTAGQGREGTGIRRDFPGLGLSLAACPPPPSSKRWGELYVQVGMCLARSLSHIYIVPHIQIPKSKVTICSFQTEVYF